MEIEESDRVTYERHHKLCTSLNMDRAAADEAWKSYLAMKQNYTLEVSSTKHYKILLSANEPVFIIQIIWDTEFKFVVQFSECSFNFV